MPKRHIHGDQPRGLQSKSANEGLPGKARLDRKTAQLCHQVLETLEQVLAEQEDELLQGLHVLQVDPAPDGSHLLVTVAPGAGHPANNSVMILSRLAEATADLRIEVASSITRRRAPSFSFKLGNFPG